MPRLSKGELAPGIARRSAENAMSVKARLTLLDKLSSATSSEPEIRFLEAFFRQDRLASLEVEALGITRMSEKTLRRYLGQLGVSMEDIAVRAKSLAPGPGPSAESTIEKSLSSQVDASAERTLDIGARYLDLLERLEKVRGSFTAIDSLLVRHFRLFAEDRQARFRRIK